MDLIAYYQICGHEFHAHLSILLEPASSLIGKRHAHPDITWRTQYLHKKQGYPTWRNIPGTYLLATCSPVLAQKNCMNITGRNLTPHKFSGHQMIAIQEYPASQSSQQSSPEITRHDGTLYPAIAKRLYMIMISSTRKDKVTKFVCEPNIRMRVHNPIE